MPKLKIYNFKTIQKKLNIRSGETKLGEKIQFVSNLENLATSEANFVIFGIPEDIGIRANYGKPGASKAWETCLSSFLNVQHNEFIISEKILLLGEIDCSEEMEKAANLEISDPNFYIKLGEFVEKIDEVVAETVKRIISAGKIPIIIGGGHNNAFGVLKGASEAFKKPINVLNIDAHTDLRKLEHRHSGNGFSFALKKRFLKKYAIFGIHQNYTPQYIFEEMQASAEIDFVTLEECMTSEKLSRVKKSVHFVNLAKFGLEVDCDAMENFPSSAKSPSGFTIQQIRNFIRCIAKEKNCCYLHLCEAAPNKENEHQVGKALTYFITDFIKMTNER